MEFSSNYDTPLEIKGMIYALMMNNFTGDKIKEFLN